MFKWIAIATISAFLTVGCSSGGLSKEAQEALGLEGAPTWVTMADGPYSAVGSAPIVNRNIGFAKSEALTKARADLIKQLGNKIKVRTNITSQRKDATLSEEAKEEILSLAQLDLKDSQVADMWATPDGKAVFVMVKLSSDTVAKMKKAVENGGGDFSAFEQSLFQTAQETQTTPAQ